MALKIFDRHFICVFCDERKRVSDAHMRVGRIGICGNCRERIGSNTPSQPYPGIGDVSFIMSSFEYREPLRNAILDYKFNNHKIYAKLFAELMREYVMSYDIWQDIDFIIPVPLHKNRLRKRGYNQSELIAAYISEYTGVKLNADVVTRVRETQQQSGLSRIERVTNVEGAFGCNSDMAGKKVVIFDDICTSGNTLRACAKPIKDAGAEHVSALTLAMHVTQNFPL